MKAIYLIVVIFVLQALATPPSSKAFTSRVHVIQQDGSSGMVSIHCFTIKVYVKMTCNMGRHRGCMIDNKKQRR